MSFHPVFVVVVLCLLNIFFHTALTQIVCPTTNPNIETTICPKESPACCPIQYSHNGYGCYMQAIDDPDLVYCCLPGPQFPGSKTLPNVMILGDSVSIGYTPDVTKNVSDIAMVQHSPWDTSDGGACNTSYGLSCFDIFMVSVNRTYIDWELVQFNFGLHDLDNSSNAEQTYGQQLTDITLKLKDYSNHSIKYLQYATTTPLMTIYNQGNHVVEDDNKIAVSIMQSNGNDIPILDLYQRVVDFCGPVPYVNCSICRVEPCSYHYNSVGYQWISVPVNNEVRNQLSH